MNKFDEKYEIRLANINDIESIMKFINEHWKQGHIMSQDRQLFEYEYVHENKVNFILAIERTTNNLEAIFGFINCSNTNDTSKKDIWGSLWKVVDSRDNMPLLGIELAKRVIELTGCRMHIGNGANPKTTIPLRRMFFKDKTASMKHFYMLNPKTHVFKIAKIQERTIHELSNYTNGSKLIKFETMDCLLARFDVDKIEALPYKDNYYVNKRYFKHPYYQYKVFGVENCTGDIDAILVTREVEQEERKVIRIVDFIGDQISFGNLQHELLDMFTSSDIEYIDFYVWGFNEESILQAGFKLKDKDDSNIIPNYFEPFSQSNVDNWVHYKYEGTTFFKADGDQDRPNTIRKGRSL